MRMEEEKGNGSPMDMMDEKIRRLSPSLDDPRLAEHEADWMAAFAAADRPGKPAGFARTGTIALAMAVGIGFVGARPGQGLSGAPHAAADQAIMTPFSIAAPLAPSTLLAE